MQSAKKNERDALQEVYRIAAQHRENFARFTWWLPKEARHDLLTLYAFCRVSDDAADLPGSAIERTATLNSIEQSLLQALAGKPAPSFYPAVAELIHRRNLPIEQFRYLLDAFRHDQIVTDWESLSALETYSEHSANPVGRLVLRILIQERISEQLDNASDSICTALQLVNFWQDVGRDFHDGRIYLPRDRREFYGVTNDVLHSGVATEGYRALVKELCEDTWKRFEIGRSGFRELRGGVGFTVDWFATVGLRLLKKIERQGYDTLIRRPTISKYDRATAAMQSIFRNPQVSA